jgi:hypothetical protein
MTALAFAASAPLRVAAAPTTSLATSSLISSRPLSRPAAASRFSRRPRVAMQQSPFSDEAEALEAKPPAKGSAVPDASGVKTVAELKEDEIKQTWQGNAWFAVIMVGMVLAVGATLARDFVPGGGPAPMG